MHRMTRAEKADLRREAGQRTRDGLQTAALELLAQRGQEGVTLREITDRAGANVAAVSYHFGDKAGLATALVAADEIHFPDPAQATAGIHFAKVMRELGVWDQVRSQLALAPNGNTAMRALAASRARRPIGCTQETEIRATSGIVLVGPLPPGCDLTTVYTAAVTSTARSSAEAMRFISRLDTGV